jgi:hypothetical protein
MAVPVSPRVVRIPERVFRDIKCPLDDVLRVHGIIPTAPYDHEELLVDGECVHRYTQPPRRPWRTPAAAGAGDPHG